MNLLARRAFVAVAIILAFNSVLLFFWHRREHTPPQFTPEQTAASLNLIAREAKKGQQRLDALNAARPSAPYIGDFVRLFPDAKVTYRYFTQTDEPGYMVEAGLHGRYILEMRLPAEFDPDRRSVIGFGEPTFSIVEVKSVNKGPTGAAETVFDPSGERHFSLEDWLRLVQHNGDFAAIGYRMITNQPVPGFENRNDAAM